jgi:hypothetical protein
LLVADHEPAGAAAKEMSRRFDVDMSTGRTFDFVHFDSSGGSPSWLVFSRTNGLLGDHAFLRGRDSTEQVRRVVSYTGQSLQGPLNSVSLLRLDEKAFDILGPRRELSGAGRSQGIALELGRGRVVILGEAAMLTAQVTDNGRLRFGMNRPGSDDRQFALNVMRWLGRGL